MQKLSLAEALMIVFMNWSNVTTEWSVMQVHKLVRVVNVIRLSSIGDDCCSLISNMTNVMSFSLYHYMRVKNGYFMSIVASFRVTIMYS